MKRKKKLSTSMTIDEFDNGYWYTAELREFAQGINIPSAKKLRKDELERSVTYFLKTGKIKEATKRNLSNAGIKDVERGLSLDLPIRRYTNDKETKKFIENEAGKLVPGLKRKSGVSYRLNRWREAQLINGVKLTYGGLVKEYVRLSQTKEPFARILHGRYINFMSDFLASEKGATRGQSARAWEELKGRTLPRPIRHGRRLGERNQSDFWTTKVLR